MWSRRPPPWAWRCGAEGISQGMGPTPSKVRSCLTAASSGGAPSASGSSVLFTSTTLLKHIAQDRLALLTRLRSDTPCSSDVFRLDVVEGLRSCAPERLCATARLSEAEPCEVGCGRYWGAHTRRSRGGGHGPTAGDRARRTRLCCGRTAAHGSCPRSPGGAPRPSPSGGATWAPACGQALSRSAVPRAPGAVEPADARRGPRRGDA